MRTLEQLQQNVSVSNCVNGQFGVRVKHWSKYLRCQSNNTLAFLRIMERYISPQVIMYGYTLRQAYEALYRECLRKNVL